MAYTPLTFGKYSGKTLPFVVFSDPGWFFWAIEKSVFTGKGALEQEARAIFRKSCAIRIPGPEGRRQAVEYALRPSDNKFASLTIVPKDQPLPDDRRFVIRKDVIDLSIPRQLSDYDKSGYTRLIQQVRQLLFGAEAGRLTTKLCEDFFDADAGFAL